MVVRNLCKMCMLCENLRKDCILAYFFILCLGNSISVWDLFEPWNGVSGTALVRKTMRGE